MVSEDTRNTGDIQCGTTNEKIPIHQANRLIRVYEKYKSVFSDEPGKVKNYQCKLCLLYTSRCV